MAISETLTALKSVLDVVNNLKSLSEAVSGGTAPGDLAKTLNGEILELQRQVYAANESALAAQKAEAGLIPKDVGDDSPRDSHI